MPNNTDTPVQNPEIQPEADALVAQFFGAPSAILEAKTEKENLTEQTESIDEETRRALRISPIRTSGHTLDDKKEFLEESELRVEQAIDNLQADVREKLLKLKDLKNRIEDEMTRIKELETTKAHIEEQMARIKELQEKMADTESEIQKIQNLV